MSSRTVSITAADTSGRPADEDSGRGGPAPCNEGDERGAVMVVHPAVEHWVDAGRAERQNAAQYVAQLEESSQHEIVSELSNHRVNVERCPRHREDRHDSRQHLVGPHALLFRPTCYQTCTIQAFMQFNLSILFVQNMTLTYLYRSSAVAEKSLSRCLK